MFSQLMMIFVIVSSFDGCFFEGPVHAFNLTKGPGMIWPGQAMFRAVSRQTQSKIYKKVYLSSSSA